MSATVPVRPERSRRASAEGPPAAFIEHLPLIAAAPGGIKKLRELILELAVRGKLVPQDPNDEPASDLFERIQAERLRMEEASVLKKAAPLQINEGGKPYDIPAGWAWVRLGELLSKIGAGSTPLGGKKAYVTEGVKFLRSQNVWNEGLRLSHVALIPAVVHQKMFGTHVQARDLLFNITGASIGRCALVPNDFDVANVSQHVSIIRPIDADTRFFLHKLLISRHVQKIVMDVQVGVSREGLSIKKLSRFVIPLPPLAEQHRIVAKVDELMTLCDQLDAQQTDAAAAHTTLVKTLLDTPTQSQTAEDFAANWQRLSVHFDTLFTTESSIDALKQALLQLAAMGKLVPQDSSDEPASELLERIQSEKVRATAEGEIKKGRFVARVDDEQHPFEVPTTWGWVRLGQLLPQFQNGESSRGNARGTLTTVLRLADIKNRRISLADTREILLNPASIQKYKLAKGDLLVIRVNGSAEIVGRFVACEEDLEAIYCDHFIRVRFHSHFVDSAFLRLLGESPLIRRQIEGLFVTTAGQKTVNQGHISSLLIPLACLHEQHRIVAKVNELMALCDQLKARLTASRAVQERLAAALIDQAAVA